MNNLPLLARYTNMEGNTRMKFAVIPGNSKSVEFDCIPYKDKLIIDKVILADDYREEFWLLKFPLDSAYDLNEFMDESELVITWFIELLKLIDMLWLDLEWKRT